MKRADSTYAELAQVLESLPLILRETRRARGLSLRAAARQMQGVSFNTLTRIERGENAQMAHVVAAMRWIDQSDGAS